MLFFISFIVFLIGASFGSFLNVVIDRLSKNESLIFGRSHCDNCKKDLAFSELIPVVSFLALSGKCKSCHYSIPRRLLLVEILGGLLFLTASLSFYVGLIGPFEAIFITLALSSFLAIFFSDLEYGIIPDEIVIFLIGMTSFYVILAAPETIINRLLSAIGAFVMFILLFFVTKTRGMGFGDVKLAFALGLLLGFPKIITAVYISFLAGAAISILLILFGKKKLRGDTIVFGPFLILGSTVSYFFGDKILSILFRF